MAVLPTLAPTSPIPTATVPPSITPIPTPEPLGTFIAVLTDGQIQGSLFTEDSLRHLYTFEGTAGQYITIRMTRVSGATDPILTLLSPAGDPLAVDDESGGNGGALLRSIELTASGEYTVLASGKNLQGGYSLVLTISAGPEIVTPTYPTPEPLLSFVEVLTPTLAIAVSGRNQLVDHVPLIGTLSEGDLDRYAFVGNAGERITVGVSPVSEGFRPQIEIVGPDGDVIASANVDNSAADGDALIANLPVRITASYVVLVTGENGTTGDYIVSYGRGVSREEVMQGRTLADNTVTGEITRRGLRDVWSLYLNAGDIIAIAATPVDNALDPLLEFALAQDETPDDTTDNVIESDDNSGGDRTAFIGEVRATVSGLYHLRVAPAGAASIGSYNLVWRYINAAPTITPQSGAVPLITIQDTVIDNNYLYYPFQGQAGQEVRIRVIAVPGSLLDPVAALIMPSGEIIGQADDSEGDLNARFTTVLPSDSTFTVRVNGYLSTGAFTLTVETLYPPP